VRTLSLRGGRVVGRRDDFRPQRGRSVVLPADEGEPAGDGQKIGEIQKVFGKSLLRSTYTLYDATGNEVATAHESSLFAALATRSGPSTAA
jgi:hypothetical protein